MSGVDSAALGGKLARGVGWKLVGQVSAQVTSGGVAIVLAHLLSPHDFGLAGMALVFTGVAGVFTDLALGPALVQRAHIDDLDRTTAFWTSFAAGLFLTVVGVAVSPLVADFFSEPAVGPLFAACSLMFVLISLSVTQTALLTREMDFRTLELRNVLSVLVGAAAAIALALAGAGAWTIVGQSLVGAAASALLLWRMSPWRPTLAYSRESLRMLGSFGVRTLLSQFLDYLTLNMDNLLVGRFLGSVALGVYAVAYNVMFLPLARITRPISQVVFSAFAKLQHDPARLREGWLRGNRIAAAVNVPAFLGMAVVAPDFVPVVLGQKWHAAVPVLQLLSIAGVMQSFQSLNWSTVQATGRAEVMLRFRLFSTPMTLAAFAVGLHWGVVGVAGLFAASRLIGLAVNTVVTCRVLGCPTWLAVRRHADVAAVALAMAAAVYAIRLGLVGAGVPAAPRLVLLSLLGLEIYLLLVMVFAPDLGEEARRLVRARTGGQPVARRSRTGLTSAPRPRSQSRNEARSAGDVA